ncbi:MAG: pirin family protein [Bdellovibrionales bacterium]|nr:pirin family protein [Bdellovibrionales bacterium]
MMIFSKRKGLDQNILFRRSLPCSKKKMIGPFIFFDHIGPMKIETGKEIYFNAHPHIGLSNLTYLFEGSVDHRDSLGNHVNIKPFETAWMTAGNGIVHSEKIYFNKYSETMEGVFLRIALPKEQENRNPSFEHIDSKNVPTINYMGQLFSIVAGSFDGFHGAVQAYSSFFCLHSQLMLPTQEFSYELPQNYEAGVYVLSGRIESEEEILHEGMMKVYDLGSQIKFKAKKHSKLIVFGGEIFPEDRYIWWGFVSSSREKIEIAKRKWKNQEFPKIYGESDYAILPEEWSI